MFQSSSLSSDVSLIAILLGLASHQYFKHHEPTALGFLSAIAILHAGVYTFLELWCGESLAASLSLSALFGLVYLTALSTSIAIYRLFFHPLQKYPGPLLCRITRLHLMHQTSKGRDYERLQRLHDKYGDVVRVGPNDVVFRDINDALLVNGPQSRLEKGPKNDATPWTVAKPLTFIRDRTEHRFRRRIWNQGFNQASVREYEPRVVALVDELCFQISRYVGQEIDAAEWATFLAFDVMGEMGFGASFGMLQSGQVHLFKTLVKEAMKAHSVWGLLPWAKPILRYIPMGGKTKERWAQFTQFSNERFQARKSQGTLRPDVFKHLLAADYESGGKLTDAELLEDAKAVIIGGSDTTTFAMAHILYQLIENPAVYANLQAEVDRLNAAGPVRGMQLGSVQAPYLNGVINEALRLLPSVPDPTQRTTGKDSVEINGKYFPPNTFLYSSTYSILRDPRHFSSPEVFMPTRWIDSQRPSEEKGFNHNTRANISFGAGLYNCVGKPLALLEMRQFLGTLLYQYKFERGARYNAQKFRDSWQSNGTMACGPLWLIPVARNIGGKGA